MIKVITYSSPRGNKINLSEAQVKALKAAQKWPKDWSGEEYCQVDYGLHFGTPIEDEDLAELVH